MIPEINLKKQSKLIETRREVERLACKSAAPGASPVACERSRHLRDEFMAAATLDDCIRLRASDRELNELSLIADRNQLAEGAVRLMHGLSRRFRYFQYKQPAALPEMARLHAAVVDAISNDNIAGAGEAHDHLLDNNENIHWSDLTA